MPSTCRTIHYDASQYRVYIPVHYFSLVIPSPPQKYPCLPCSLPSLLPCSSIRSVAPSLPAPSFLRSLSPSFLSLAPSMPRFVPSSLVPFQAWYLCRVLTVWRRLLLTLPQPSLPTSTPVPSLSHIIASSLPPSRPLLPPSLPPSILPRPFPVSHHRFLPHSRPLLPPSLPPSILPISFPAPRCPPAPYRATQYTPCVYTVLVTCTGYCVGRAQPGGVTQPGVALRQWSGRAISRWLAVTLATHPNDESVFDE